MSTAASGLPLRPSSRAERGPEGGRGPDGGGIGSCWDGCGGAGSCCEGCGGPGRRRTGGTAPRVSSAAGGGGGVGSCCDGCGGVGSCWGGCGGGRARGAARGGAGRWAE